MFDPKWIRENPEAFDAGLAKRGLEPHSAEIIALDDARRGIVTRLQEAQTRRNAASKEIGKAKASGDEARATALMDEVASLKTRLQEGEEELRQAEARLNEALAAIPNLPLDDVPVGEDETDNVLVREWGEKPGFDFTPKEHFDIGEGLGQMDFETAAKLSGSRFAVLRRDLARMERALAAFMLDIHTAEFGYNEVIPPFLVRDDAMFGTGQLPKFAEDLFHTEDGYWLIPTAEVSLTNLVRESTVGEDELPMRFTAWTPCFRAEAGAAGKDTRGLIRQHQFSKVELVSITTPDQSLDELERMTSCAEEILKRLGLPYRIMTLCTGDMGFAARKTYDIEVWLPGQARYREISSCSVCGEFQARRMNARYRAGEKDLRFVHTLNGSGLAVGRTMVAILENCQESDGSVRVPEALQPYMNGLDRIETA
ncbi:serine--tRNA ligase [Dichotomicrobium thermohalophilum]|uniref:Serine--tRNA ligase n=1 Tax=Dichotomicrobium thermohalophilum TaxID=933063 RepID=A0A397QC29_9HYPH|nr:serine--tRNA ligase [Dichotomicrobium thermohalophilum]RIA55654.1 seryl-tRNA synthetase [Dichotomicrobium thermohalophilum]